MWWRRGWFLNSLNYQIEKDLRESIYKNEAFGEHCWNLIERQVLKWSASPVEYTLLVFLACLLNMVSLRLWVPELLKFIPVWKQPWNVIVDWQKVVFGGQVTIIGLIFPLVIGFVGTLIKNKSANRALWQIYRRYSGFLFVGYSGLMLCAFFIVGQLVHPWLGFLHDVIFSIGICAWFLLNLLLSAWFLYATFLFVDTKSRNELVLRYCINESLVVEIKSRLSKLIPLRAPEKKLLGNFVQENNGVRVRSISFSHENGKKIQVSFKSKKYLRNIYFRLLTITVFLWKMRASRLTGNNQEAELILPATGETFADKWWLLAETRNLPLNRVEKFFLRLSYKFGPLATLETSSWSPIIDALVGDVNDSLRENNLRQFELSIEEIEQWHSDIMGAAAFINDNGEWANWLLLTNGSFMGGNTLLNELSHEYYQMSRLVLQRLPDTRRFFEKLCYLYLHIHGYKNDRLANKIVEELIIGHGSVWLALMIWHSNSEFDHAESIPMQQYESALRIFVGSWEHWSSVLPLEIENWSQLKQPIAHHLCHLKATSRQIITALRHREFVAAEWATDMLVHWYENTFTHNTPSQFGWNTTFLVHSLLGLEITEPIWEQILNGEVLDEADGVYIALNNSWLDTCIITACYILNKPNNQLDDKVKKIASALLHGTRLRSTDGLSGTQHQITKGADVLQAYIRYQWYWEYGDGIYGNWLNGIVDSFGQIEKEEYVSGRIYSGYGARDVHSLQAAYIAITIGLSVSEWTLRPKIFDFICSDVLNLKQRGRLIGELNQWQEPSEDTIGKAKLIAGDSYKSEYLENYKRSIAKLIAQLTDRNRENIISAPIDAERLVDFGKHASSTAFSLETDRIPFSLFNTVEYVDVLEDVYKSIINIGNYRRSEIAEGLGATSTASHRLDKLVTDNVSHQLYRNFLQKINFVDSSFTDGRKLIAQAVTDSVELIDIGKTPILFIGPWDIYMMFDATFWNFGKIEDRLPFVIRKDDGYPDSYICHVEDVAVYRMPGSQIDYCVLLAQESFDKIKIRKIGDKQYVKAAFIDDEVEGSVKGTLRLSYWMKLQLLQNPSFKYILKAKEESTA